MVARRTDSPRSPTDRILDTSSRLEGLRADTSRGAPALRNNASHRLLLDEESADPLLVPTSSEGENRNVTVRFQPGVVDVRNSADDSFRDFGARQMWARGLLYGEDDVIAEGSVTSTAELFANGGITSYGVSKTFNFVDGRGFYDTANFGFRGLYDAGIYTTGGAIACMDGQGNQFRGIYSTNFATVLPSWRGLKREVRPTEEFLGRSALSVVRDLEIAAWKYDPDQIDEHDTDEQHYGPMLDEVPQELIVDLPAPPPVGSQPGGIDPPLPAERDDRHSYDRDKVLSLALAAIQDLAAENAALRARVDALEAA